MSELKRTLSLLLLCDTPSLIEQALVHIDGLYSLEKKQLKNFSEWEEDILASKSLVFWSEQKEMPLQEVLNRVKGHPVIVIVNSGNIDSQRKALRMETQEVMSEERWPLLPEILERLFKKQEEDQQVKQLQDILRALIKDNTDAIIGHDYHAITYVNDYLLQLLDYRTKEELIGQPLSKIVYTKDVPQYLVAIPSEERKTSFEQVKQVRFILKGKEVLRANIQAMALPKNDRPQAFWKIQATASYKSINLTNTSESALLIKYADQVPGVMYQYHVFPDDRLEFPFVSDRLSDLCAIPVEALRRNGNIFYKYMHPDDLDRYFKIGHVSRTQLTKMSLDFRLKAKEGGYRWMHASSKPIRLPDQSVLWYGYMEDITDEKLAEQAYRDSEEQVRALFEHAPDGIAILDKYAVVVRWNPKAEAMFGWSSEEIIGHPLYKKIAPEERQFVYEESVANFHEKADRSFLNTSLELRAIRKNGEEFPILMSISEMNNQGKFYFLCFMGDITTRKQAENKLQESLLEKEVLLKEIHHRVKNNLQVITSLLSLQASFIDDSFISDIFKKSQYRINSMGMVHEMLYQSKDLAKINYQEYLERLTASLKIAMVDYKKNIEVVLEVPEVSLNVDTAIPLSLIINELLTNAFKYAFIGRKQGQVKLTLEALEEPRFLMYITDDGVGYSNALPTDNAPSLGLLLVRKLAMQLKGSIQRIAVEKGTHYRLLFEEITSS
jgi:PAS domain S-box-containing protein